MSQLGDLLSDLHGQGIHLRVEGENLRFNAPKDAFTPELKTRVRDNKAAIVAFLRGMAGDDGRPPIAHRQRPDRIPLSFAQQRLWFMNKLESGATYNMPKVIHFHGDLNVPALNACLDALVARHEILRTAFPEEDGTPYQAIADHLDVPFRIVDVSAMSEEKAEAMVDDAANSGARLPFDLTTCPLLRVSLFRRGPEHHTLVLIMHHIVGDGWSFGVIVSELVALYRAASTGSKEELPPLPCQYADFALWQREVLDEHGLAKQLRYWRDRLADAPRLLALPHDRPRPEIATFAGSRVPVRLNADLTAKLRHMCAQTGTTLYMGAKAAFLALIGQLSGRDDLVLGTPIANRNRREIEPLIGFFVNTLAVRHDLSGNPQFLDLMDRVRHASLDAYENQDVPFEQVVETLAPKRAANHTPLFQVMFVLQNAPTGNLTMKGLRIEPGDVEQTTAKFDLTLTLVEVDDRIQGSMEFSTELFDKETADHFVDAYRRLLEAVSENPNLPLSELLPPTTEERHDTLETWNETASNTSRHDLFHRWFEERVELTPHTVALRRWQQEDDAPDDSWSFRQLNNRANLIAQALREAGAGPESRVAVLLDREPLLVASLLAVLKCGAAYVPLQPKDPLDRVAFVLEDAKPIRVLTSASHVDKLPSGAPLLMIDGNDVPWRGDEAGIDPFTAAPVANLNIPADALNTAYVLYTSGSTGRPKGVPVSHQALLHYLHWAVAAYRADQGRGAPLFAPLAFDATITSLWVPLAAGNEVLLLSEKDEIEALAEVVFSQRAFSLIKLTPAHLALLERFGQDEGGLAPNALVRTGAFVLGGEALPAETLARWQKRAPSTRFINEYGPTETTVGCCIYDATDYNHDTGHVPIGRPIANTQLYVLNAKMEPLMPCTPGELFIAGGGLARGYLGRPSLTAKKFLPNPFSSEAGSRLYRTGDLTRLNRDGNLHFLGRVDDQIKLRGYRIELGEIESLLLSEPGVRETAVNLRQDMDIEGRPDPRLVAYLVADIHALDQERVEIAEDTKDSEQLGHDLVNEWESVFNDAYSRERDNSDPTLNVLGWTDSYSGDLIAEGAMREWVEATVARVLAHKPKDMLEIGCGTGMLLWRIAPHVATYRGCDISNEGLGYVRNLLKQAEWDTSGVSLEERPAHMIDELPEACVDTVMINSVLQYFPSSDYLVDVIEAALGRVRKGGRIFLGDVRILTNLKLQASDIQLNRASEHATAEQIRHLVEDAVAMDPELVLAPDYFQVLRRRFPRITGIRLERKAGVALHEMNRFRCDVTLEIDGEDTWAEPMAWMPWQDKATDWEMLFKRARSGETIAMRDVPDARRTRPAASLTVLEEADSSDTAGELRSRLESRRVNGVQPQRFFDLFPGEPHRVWLRPSKTDAAGMDVILNPQRADLSAPSAGSSDREALRALSNQPLHGKIVRELVPRLRTSLRAKLPEYMVPSAFVVLDAMPLTRNGKIDRRALPAPKDADRLAAAAGPPPRTPAEKSLASIWCEVLGIEKTAINANFFDLGGHSLLATQVVSRVKQVFDVELKVRDLFDAPTLAELAQRLEDARRDQTAFRVERLEPVTRDRPLPLSFAQQRLWFLYELEDRSSTYNLPASLRLHGRLDTAALERSVTAMMARHESLRTIFTTVDGTPVQTFRNAYPYRVPLTDLSGLPRHEATDLLFKLARRESDAPFDLDQAPPWRMHLVRISTTEHLLMLTMHHIISDGWSMSVAVRELAALYEAFATGADFSEAGENLPVMPIQYADFAYWQRQWLADDGLQKQLSYWGGQLDGIPVTHDLPLDKPRPRLQSYAGAKRGFRIDDGLAQKVRNLSRAEGVSLFMTLQAAFAILVYRYSGQDDIALGSPIANRQHEALEPLIGFFVNTLVIRNDLSGHPSFRDLLRRVRQTALDAYANQDVPFEQVVEALQPERNLGQTPLFQLMFILQNTPPAELDLPLLNMSFLKTEHRKSMFDLTLSLEDTSRGMVGSFEYCTDLFEETTIHRMIDHLRALLRGITADPDLSIDRVRLLGAGEREKLLNEYGGDVVDYPLETSVHQLVEAQAARQPQEPAVLYETENGTCERLTYGDLNSRANQLAHRLVELGIGPGMSVAMCMSRSPEAFVTFLAVMKAGGTALPLDPAFPVERVTTMLEAVDAKVLVAQAALASSLPADNIAVVPVERGGTISGNYAATNLPVRSTMDHLAYFIFTSGSTGKPKGVAITNRSWANAFHAWNDKYPLADVRNHLQMASFTFDVFCGDFVRAFCSGAALTVVQRETMLEPASLYRLMQRERVDAAEFVPAVMRVLVAHLERTGQNLNFMKLLAVGSDAWNGEECEALFTLCGKETMLVNSYGLTEATIDSTWYQRVPGKPAPAGPMPIGKPFPNSGVLILDKGGALAPVGIPGELCIAGTGLARGYHGQPDLTADRFTPHPFPSKPGQRLYRTGDRARWLPGGDLLFLGRNDFQIKLRGFRIEPGEIETIIAEDEHVAEVLVQMREDRPGQRRLAAYVVANSDALPSDEWSVRLRERCESRLPRHMVPSAFMVLDAFPLTPNGKVNRRGLPAPKSGGETGYIAPRDETEASMAMIWAEVLDMERISVHDDFFMLGGHSLMAARVISRITSTFGLKLPLASLFEKPTVAELSILIRAMQWANRVQSRAETENAPQRQNDGSMASDLTTGGGSDDGAREEFEL